MDPARGESPIQVEILEAPAPKLVGIAVGRAERIVENKHRTAAECFLVMLNNARALAGRNGHRFGAAPCDRRSASALHWRVVRPHRQIINVVKTSVRARIRRQRAADVLDPRYRIKDGPAI
jgi:hypothetical protein